MTIVVGVVGRKSVAQLFEKIGARVRRYRSLSWISCTWRRAFKVVLKLDDVVQQP